MNLISTQDISPQENIKLRRRKGLNRYAGACHIYILSQAEMAYYNFPFYSMTVNLHSISVKLVIRPPLSRGAIKCEIFIVKPHSLRTLLPRQYSNYHLNIFRRFFLLKILSKILIWMVLYFKILH